MNLAKKKNQGKRMKQENDRFQSELEDLRKQNLGIRKHIDEKENEIKELKKQIQQLIDQIGTVAKHQTAEETQIERIKNKQHDLYQECQREEISLLGNQGKFISVIEELSTSQDTQSAIQIEEEISRRLDYTKVKDLKATTPAEYEDINNQYRTEIMRLGADLDKISPNLKAEERYAGVNERAKGINDDFEESRKEAKSAAELFKQKKNERIERFQSCYSQIHAVIDGIYKDLTKTSPEGDAPVGGAAYLSLDNQEEPYNGGTKYNVVPPNKRFREMEALSGGEKTVAALALLFAINTFRPCPFFVLDEIDAPLDPTNVQKVSRFIRERSQEVQFIIISLKDSFYSRADALLGVYRDQDLNSSGVVTLDLTEYPV